jgi:TRAP-type C4-dicarboxylate transport system permease small subunit
MQTFAGLVDRALRALLVLLVVMLVVSVSWQVLSRYILADPASWTEELARFLLIWIGMLGASFAFRQKAHLGLELLPGKLDGIQATMLRYFTLAVIALFAGAVLIAGGVNLVSLTWELRQYSAVLGMPIAWVYSVVPLTGALIVFFCIVQAFEADNDPGTTQDREEL